LQYINHETSFYSRAGWSRWLQLVMLFAFGALRFGLFKCPSFLSPSKVVPSGIPAPFSFGCRVAAERCRSAKGRTPDIAPAAAHARLSPPEATYIYSYRINPFDSAALQAAPLSYNRIMQSSPQTALRSPNAKALRVYLSMYILYPTSSNSALSA